MVTADDRMQFTSGSEQLLAELGRLELLLAREAARLRASDVLRDEDPFRGLYVSDAHADALFARNGSEPDEAVDLGEAADMARLTLDAATTPDLPLQRLASAFGLDRFEIDSLLLAVAPELDRRCEVIYGYVQNDVTKRLPTVDLALHVLCEAASERLARRAVFAPDAPLRRDGLIRLVEDPHAPAAPLPSQQMKADGRIVDFLLDRHEIDERLRGIAHRVTGAPTLDELVLNEDLVAGLRGVAGATAVSIVLQGDQGAGKQAVAGGFASELGRSLLALRLPDDGDLTCLGPAERECVLEGSVLYVAAGPGQVEAAADALAATRVPVIIGCAPPCPVLDAAVLTFELEPSRFADRVRLWREQLAASGLTLARTADVDSLAGKFSLGPGEIAAAVGDIARRRQLEGSRRRVSTGELHVAARARSGGGLDELANRVAPHFRWSDLVVPSFTRERLNALRHSIEQRRFVHSAWGYDEVLSLGNGIHALFAGPSGTGKTMAADVLAHDLGLDLYKIDLSSVVSKYIGETEKNLARIFEAAETSDGILFFDEADALFGKRSEVRDSHDRYANIEIAYLLQRMDEYDGVVILATNLSGNLDDAFTRRLHHVVEFPLPDRSLRERIWRGMFPRQAPVAGDVDIPGLAEQFELTGGNIRNVVLAAAYEAAARGAQITMADLLAAASAELEKLGWLPEPAD